MRKKTANQRNDGKLWIDRPAWRVISWVALVLSPLLAVVALVIALSASNTALEVESRQLREMQKRPFLSLAFVMGKKYTYSVFYPESEVTHKRNFHLGLVNSGPMYSEEGQLQLFVPKYLKVDSIVALSDVVRSVHPMNEIIEWEKFDVYSIMFGTIYPGGGPFDPVMGMVIPLFSIWLGLRDTVNAKDHLQWEIIYGISAKDIDGLYRRRTLGIYFGTDEESQKILDSLDFEKNQYIPRYRLE